MTEVNTANQPRLMLDISSADAEVIFKALSNPVRLRVLEFLSTHAFTVAQISNALDIPVSTLNQHLKVLEEAGLIHTYLRAASRGNEKVCAGAYSTLECNLLPANEGQERSTEVTMPIGAYSDFEIVAPCGLASVNKIIGMQGEVSAFVEPERMEAQLLWFTAGYIEYRFPKKLPPRTVPGSLYLSMEICSEAPHYHLDWPSDITVWINGYEIGTWTSPGDFGGQRGYLTPEWWSVNGSQYGQLKTWKVDNTGSYIDGYESSNITLPDLNIEDATFIAVRIGVKADADYKGGLNLFGRNFGNYPQDIVLRLVYDVI